MARNRCSIRASHARTDTLSSEPWRLAQCERGARRRPRPRPVRADFHGRSRNRLEDDRVASLRRENFSTILAATHDCSGRPGHCGVLRESEVDQLSGVGHTAGVGVERRRQLVGLIGAVLAGIAACGDPVPTDLFDTSGLGGAAAASGRGHLGGNGGRAGSAEELGGAPSEEAGEGQGASAGESGGAPSGGASGSAGRTGVGGAGSGGATGAAGNGGGGRAGAGVGGAGGRSNWRGRQRRRWKSGRAARATQAAAEELVARATQAAAEEPVARATQAAAEEPVARATQAAAEELVARATQAAAEKLAAAARAPPVRRIARATPTAPWLLASQPAAVARVSSAMANRARAPSRAISCTSQSPRSGAALT